VFSFLSFHSTTLEGRRLVGVRSESASVLDPSRAVRHVCDKTLSGGNPVRGELDFPCGRVVEFTPIRSHILTAWRRVSHYSGLLVRCSPMFVHRMRGPQLVTFRGGVSCENYLLKAIVGFLCSSAAPQSGSEVTTCSSWRSGTRLPVPLRPPRVKAPRCWRLLRRASERLDRKDKQITKKWTRPGDAGVVSRKGI